MVSQVELLTLVLLCSLILLLYCYNKKSKEGFGIDNKPFEPENTLLNRNPWDDIDYIVPSVKMPADW